MSGDFPKFLEVINSKTLEILETIEKGKLSILRSKYPKSTLHHALSKLRCANLLEKRKNGYCLTPAGSLYLKMLRKFCKCLEKFDEVLKAFPDHIVDFPEEFAMRLDEIGNFEVIVAKSTDVTKPLKVLTELILSSKEIRAVSPMFYPDYPSIFKGVVEHVSFVELVVTDDVWKQIKIYNHINNYSNKFRVYVTEKHPYFAFIVSDKFFSANFYRKTGEYDFWRTMISRDESAIRLGRDLFEFYKVKSKRTL